MSLYAISNFSNKSSKINLPNKMNVQLRLQKWFFHRIEGDRRYLAYTLCIFRLPFWSRPSFGFNYRWYNFFLGNRQRSLNLFKNSFRIYIRNVKFFFIYWILRAACAIYLKMMTFLFTRENHLLFLLWLSNALVDVKWKTMLWCYNNWPFRKTQMKQGRFFS